MRYLAPALAMVVTMILQGCVNQLGPRGSSKATLPSPMLAAYTSGASVQQITEGVKRGLNVMFWSFMELEGNTLKGGLSSDAIRPVYEALVQMNRHDVLHFVSFGGWDAEHTLAGTCGSHACTGEAYAKAFRDWNERIKSEIPGFPGFAGIDWDLEGVDKLKSRSNTFTLATFDILLSMTRALQDDFLVSMAPPQSYFNCGTSGFNMKLTNSAQSDPNFKYAGKNAYALLYAKCPDCFDVVMLQLYESYSPAGFDLYWAGDSSHVGVPGWPRNATNADMLTVLQNSMQCLASGWKIDFNGFWNVSSQVVLVPPSKIVIGLANSWAIRSRRKHEVPFFDGTQCGKAWCEGVTFQSIQNVPIRGFMYWDIHDDTISASLVTEMAIAMTSCRQNDLEWASVIALGIMGYCTGLASGIAAGIYWGLFRLPKKC